MKCLRKEKKIQKHNLYIFNVRPFFLEEENVFLRRMEVYFKILNTLKKGKEVISERYFQNNTKTLLIIAQ